MTQAIYKLGDKDNHTYVTEGIYYLFDVIEDDGEVPQGWVTEFSKLKGGENEVQKQGQAPSEEIKRRGRPKVNHGLD